MKNNQNKLLLHAVVAVITLLNVSCAGFRGFDNSAELVRVIGVLEGGQLRFSLYNSSEQDLMLILSSRDIVYYEIFTGKDYASETGGDLYPGRIVILQKNSPFAESAWSTGDSGISLREIPVDAKESMNISKVIVKPFIVPFSALKDVKSYRDLLALAQRELRGYEVKIVRRQDSPNPSKDNPKLEKQDSDKDKGNKGE